MYNSNKQFISILSDYGFKVTFGNESDTRFLRKALQALIQSPTVITKVEFIESEILGITQDSRGGIYDVACVDESGTQFIVEMQLSKYPDFIQRMKFYSFYRLNTLIRKGNYGFEDLPKIYCIGILAKNILPNIVDYHTVATLRNEKGELIDEQTTFVTVELAKFKKSMTNIHADLDKLIYTMKTLHKTKKPIQYPQFWTEEWLEVAIKELETRVFTPDQRMAYEMTLATNAMIVRAEQKKVDKAVQKATRKATQQATQIATHEATQKKEVEVVENALKKGLDVNAVAYIAGVPVDFVLDVQQRLSDNK